MEIRHVCQILDLGCEMIYVNGRSTTVEWDPEAPNAEYFSKMTRKQCRRFWNRYTTERRKFYQDVADITRQKILVADLGRNGISKTTTFVPKGALPN